jgi:endonuclease/exonuclease/phosphatase (EEP) superfamily protein YafD
VRLPAFRALEWPSLALERAIDQNLNARMRFQYDIFDVTRLLATNLLPPGALQTRIFMIVRIALALMVLLPCMLASASAQDVPGIEICTVEKTMERRTSCLQSNVDFLQKTIAKLAADHQQKLDAANRQVEALKAYALAQQKSIEDLKTAQAKLGDDLKKKLDAPAAAAKEGGK